jgi:hypothetical protein
LTEGSKPLRIPPTYYAFDPTLETHKGHASRTGVVASYRFEVIGVLCQVRTPTCVSPV